MPHLVPAVLVLEDVKYCRGYSVPNIKGSTGTIPYINTMEGTGVFDIDGQGQVQATGTTPTAYCYLSFNASSSCGLYRDDVTTVQTASILGLFLIRSY